MGLRLALVCQRNNNVPFLFESAAAAGHELVLIHAPGESAPGHLPAAGPLLELDVFDAPDAALDELEAAASALALDGILTCREEAVPWTALAARRLGLPGIDPSASLAARDKATMRARFAAAGLNVPRHVRLGPEDAIAPPPGLTFPVVVKPTGGYSSQGVIRVDGPGGLADAVERVRAINADDLRAYTRDPVADGVRGEGWGAVIVEEFIDGPEYVAEAFAVDGRVHVLSIGYKGDPKGPHFEESVYLAPPPLPAEAVSAVVEQVAGGMAALGLTEGPGHCELRLRGGKTPVLLEIGARIGGSGVSQFVVQESTGIDYAGLQFRQAAGAPLPDLPPTPEPHAAAGNWIIPLGGHGRLVEIAGLSAVAAHPDTRRILTFLDPGAVVRPYPAFTGYPGFILSRHADWRAGVDYHRWLA
ncbi:MAG: ATP-grasp domain-containing protein [Azospirillaceae bacterium]